LNWLVGISKALTKYSEIFRGRDVDGYWLLNHVDRDWLRNNGIANETHQNSIIDQIEKTREKCPPHFSIEL
jgi:hypothetical protein